MLLDLEAINMLHKYYKLVNASGPYFTPGKGVDKSTGSKASPDLFVF